MSFPGRMLTGMESHDMKYSMEEYVAEVNSMNTDLQKKYRKGEHIWTEHLYWICFVLLIFQCIGLGYFICAKCHPSMVCLYWGSIVEPGRTFLSRINDIDILHILLLKITGLIFWLCSYLAWRKQQDTDIEVYGQIMTDISSRIPLSEYLNRIFKKHDKDYRIIVNWLRNRPSIPIMTMYLCMNIGCMPILMPGLLNRISGGNITEYAKGWISLIFVFLIPILSFVCLIPWSSYQYKWHLRKESSKPALWRWWIVFCVVLFILPTVFSVLFVPWLCTTLVVVLGAIIICLLIYSSKKTIREMESQDRTLSTRLHADSIDFINAESSNSADLSKGINKNFNLLSSQGQIRYLEWLEVAIGHNRKYMNIRNEITLENEQWKPKSDQVFVQMMHLLSLKLPEKKEHDID